MLLFHFDLKNQNEKCRVNPKFFSINKNNPKYTISKIDKIISSTIVGIKNIPCKLLDLGKLNNKNLLIPENINIAEIKILAKKSIKLTNRIVII